MTKTRTVSTFYKRKTADQKKNGEYVFKIHLKNCEKIYPIQQKK